MDRRVYQETELRSPFLPWSDQVTRNIYVSYVAHLASSRVVSFPEFRSCPLVLTWDLWEMCRSLIRHRQLCVQDVPVSPAPEVGGVSLLAKALSAVTFIVCLCLSCDDVYCARASGGHTTEIIRLMESLSAVYTPRHYVLADTDRISEDKVRTFEASRQSAKSQVHSIISCSAIFV